MALQVKRSTKKQDLTAQWLKANGSARRSGRLPVITMSGGSCPGNLLIIHEIDLAAVAAQIAELTAFLDAS